MIRRITALVALTSLLVLLSGCGGSGEKDKNKDKDVPKPAKADPAG